MCVHISVQLSYTTQHRTVLIIFSVILQTIIIVQIMSTGGEGPKIRKRLDIVLRQDSVSTNNVTATERAGIVLTSL